MRWFFGIANNSPAIRAAANCPACLSAAFSASLGSAGRLPLASTLRASASLRSFATCTSYIAASSGSAGIGSFPSATRWILPRSGNTVSTCSGVMFSVGKSFSRPFSTGSLIASGFNCCANHASAPIASTWSTSPGLAPNVNRSSNCCARSRSVSGTSAASFATTFGCDTPGFAASARAAVFCRASIADASFCASTGAIHVVPTANSTTESMRIAGLATSLDPVPTGEVALTPSPQPVFARPASPFGHGSLRSTPPAPPAAPPAPA